MHVHVQALHRRLGFHDSQVQGIVWREAQMGQAPFEPVQDVHRWKKRLV
jgi:hypothetical protein